MSQLLLLVDDDPMMAAIVAVHARRFGCQLVCAQDADIATGLLLKATLVLLDVNLGGVTGPNWLATLGERPPVALFVQSSLAEDIADGWNAGADFLFPKELVADPERWRSRLTEILTHPDGQQGVPSCINDSLISNEVLLRVLEGLPRPLADAIRRRPTPDLADQLIRLLGSAELAERIRGV